jgi:antitoxin FitA
MNTLQSLIAIFQAQAMASITIRNLDAQTKERLRIRAAHQGRSMEDEARNILRTAVAKDAGTPRNLAQAIRNRFEPLGGVKLQLPEREPMRKPPHPGR